MIPFVLMLGQIVQSSTSKSVTTEIRIRPEMEVGEVNKLIAQGLQSPGSSLLIRLPDRVWTLSGPLVIGSSKKQVRLIGSPGKSVLSGTRRVTGWTVGPDGRWRARLSEVGSGQTYYSQLFMNGVRRDRPRWPKSGYSLIEKRVDPLSENAGKGSDGFVFPNGSLKPEWSNRDDIDVLTWLEWSIVWGKIRSLDSATRVVRFKQPTQINDGWARFRETYRFFAENVKEALSEPGEWYLDRPTGELTYIPIPGETSEKTVAMLPAIRQLLVVDGSQVEISGVEFTGTSTSIPASGRFFYQAEADLEGAITFVNSNDSRVVDCKFTRLGEHAVRIKENCKRIAVEKCQMIDLGGGGVYVGEMMNRKPEDGQTVECTVADNTILGFGRIHPAAVGIWVGNNAFNTLARNWIEDGYYSGISVGWSWGYAPSGSHSNRIIDNTILNLGHRVMSDMGGIYTLSPSPNTRISGNRITNVDGYSYGGWGIYPDEGSSDMVIEKNVVWGTRSEAFHCHYGKNITVRNNVFYGSKQYGLIRRSREEKHVSLIATRNIFVSTGSPIVNPEGSGKQWQNTQYDGNLYWFEGAGKDARERMSFAGLTMRDWQQKGQDSRSIVGDPRFRNPSAGDFRLDQNAASSILFEVHPRLAPTVRPKGLPKEVKKTYPVPTVFNPAIWN